MKQYIILGSIVAIFFSCSNNESFIPYQVDIFGFLDQMAIDTSETNDILILPLSGCGEQLDPIMANLKLKRWKCPTQSDSKIILSADFPKQLGMETTFEKGSLPPCIVFDSVNVAFSNKLVFNAPTLFLRNGNGHDLISFESEDWISILKDKFGISLARMP